MSDSAVAQLRSFSRLFTERIGALDHHFLGRARPLAEARVLWEVGAGVGGLGVNELRRRLDLDSGHASRLLRRLEADGLIEVEAAPHDGRQRVISLTTQGQEEWRAIDRLSDERAADLLAPLGDRRAAQLIDRLGEAALLIEAATVGFDVVDPRSDDAVGAMSAYFVELDERFPTGFDPGDTLTDDAGQFDPPGGAFVVARNGDRSVGCGGVLTLDSGVAEIKRMWIAPEMRGLGLASRLLGELESHARQLGHERVRLDTNATLTTAIAMYERAGYRSVERYNDNPYAQRWFEKDLPS